MLAGGAAIQTNRTFPPKGQNPCGAPPSATSGLPDFPAVVTTLQFLQSLGHTPHQ